MDNSKTKRGFVLAIDGPAGTGKSTVTKRLCEELGFTHVDTGALYRAIAVLMLERSDQEVLSRAEEAVELARSTHLEFKFDRSQSPSNRLFANGRDVTPFLRTPEVSKAASAVSSIPGVRAALLGLQRVLGCRGDSVLEGRDIGTVIFPDADLKIFLDASIDERAKRRWLELKQAGKAMALEEVARQIAERDHADSTRSIAPLKKAKDAVFMDTSSLSIDEVVEQLKNQVRELYKGQKKI